MSAVSEDLLRVIRLMVDEPDLVEVEEVPDDRGVVLQLRVADGDLGKIIGRQGRTARALRTLLAARETKDGTEYSLEILDD